jgi:hypothetical protein
MRRTFLGLLLVAASVSLGASPLASEPPRLDGTWGGDRIRLAASGGEVEIQIECLKARTEEPIALDARGAFVVHLRFQPIRGANLEGDELREPARVSGRVEGEVLRLEVGPAGIEGAGTYVLKRGQAAKLPNCRLRG